VHQHLSCITKTLFFPILFAVSLSVAREISLIDTTLQTLVDRCGSGDSDVVRAAAVVSNQTQADAADLKLATVYSCVLP
jgi:hypothetical protein